MYNSFRCFNVQFNQFTTYSASHYFSRCKKLIDQGDKELYLHSLGAAIPRALNLALSVQKAYGAAITLETATSTVELTGNLQVVKIKNHY